jgi:putative membrane protein
MKKFVTICLILTLCIAACENRRQNKDPKDLAEDQNEAHFDNTRVEDDAEFAVKAADGGMMEVELGRLAQNKAVHKEVKDFGAMMVADHTGANNELKSLAQKRNISLPAALGKDKQKKYDEFNAKQSGEFDSEYISFMIKDHKEDIEDFREQSKEGKDAALSNWAASKIPTLEHHLAEAQRIDSVLKKR